MNNMAKNTDEKINIQEAIKSFANDDITNAGISLFSVLGYDTSLQAPLEKKTYMEFKENYIDSSPSADRFSEEKALVSDWKSIDILFQLTNDSFNGTKSLFEESINPTDMQSYLCFAIELINEDYSKSQIANITREINKLFSIPIIIIFKYSKLLTLSVINRRVNKRNSDRDVLEKVTLIKDIFFEKPRRAHIEILFDMSFAQLNAEYTIYNFETLHKAWSEVLDTQTLNKRFYTELSNWYFWAIKTVVYPGYEMEAEKNSLFTKEDKLREHNAKNLIRLLTRLLFVWFIKEKDLIPEELFDEQVINNLITSFEPDKYYSSDAIDKENKSIYYKAILQNLFFASLNAEHGKRAFRLDGQNQNATSLMRYQRFHKNPHGFVELIETKVPFMNGGLFECLDHQDDEKKGKKGGAIINYEDGFSDRKDNELFVPDYVFFGKDVKVDLSAEYDDKKKKDVTVNGIINILQKYKFTIAENTPVEEDIALDPELLGRVFENLLASYNPETKTNARKQTGSFYTPRPIVEYMVDESLKAYLITKIKDSALSKGTLEEKTKAAEEIENNLDSKLDNLIAYNESEPEFSDEERFQILKYLDECKILDPACGSGAFPMGILQKMVYVIHKLDPQNDNWKLLQVEKITQDKNLSAKEKNEMISEISSVFDDNELDYARKLYLIENCIHGIDIQPIATQISRLRFFISLIVDQKVDGNKANFGVRPLPNLENRFVTANSLIGLDEQQAYLSTVEMDNLLKQLQKVRHDLFKAKTPKHKFELRQQDKEIREKLEQDLISVGFGKENARLLSTWDPYDKNRSAEFFDAEWMYGIKDGFDVVIGNPPYIDSETMTRVMPEMREKYTEIFETAKGNWDIYVLFFELALKKQRQGGTTAFIVPNKIVSIGYAEAIRDYIAKNADFISLRDYSRVSVFDASVYPCTLIFSKTKVKNIEIAKMVEIDEIGYKNILTNELFYSQNNWNGWLCTPDEVSLLTKLIEKSKYVVKDKYTVSAAATVNEAYQVKEILDDNSYSKETFKLINSGTIDRYSSLWGIKDTKYIKGSYKTPVVNKRTLKNILPKRYELAETEKLIVASMTKILEVFYDEGVYLAGKSTTCILENTNEYNLKLLIGILNSKLESFWLIRKYNSQAMSGEAINVSTPVVENLPLPDLSENDKQDIINLVNKILAAKKVDSSADTIEWEKQIDQKVYELYGLTSEEIAIVEGR